MPQKQLQEARHLAATCNARRINNVGQYSTNSTDGLLDYMFDHFDEFSLLLDASYGTLFQNFVNELVDIEVEYTFMYMQLIGCESITSGVVTEEFLHIIVTAYMNGLFEVIRHGMNRVDAKRYVKMLSDYHRAGFETIFSPLND
ncbi:MAG: TetR/AcrR family transcriptional regulator [Clostridiales bacterium]|nr:TetR/AcrR family transcriptional regulator [Clostridiales bacterium]